MKISAYNYKNYSNKHNSNTNNAIQNSEQINHTELLKTVNTEYYKQLALNFTGKIIIKPIATIKDYKVENENGEMIGDYSTYVKEIGEIDNENIDNIKLGNNELYISYIHLNKDFRGKHTGFTTAVFNDIIKTAKKQGLKKLCLHVLPENKKAIELYKRWGFEVKDKKSPNSTNYALYMEKEIE